MKHQLTLLAAVAGLTSVAGAQSIVQQWSAGTLFSGGLEYANDTVWVADENAVLIYEFKRDGTPVKNFPATGGLLPIGVGFDPGTGMLWIGDEGELLYEMDPVTGLATGVSFSTLPAITDVSGVAVDPATGNIFVSQDSGTRMVVEFDQTGMVVSTTDLTPSGSLDPDGLAYRASTDTFLLGDDGADKIIEVDRMGNLVQEWNMALLGISPEGVGVDEVAGTVFISDGSFGTPGSNMVFEVSGIVTPVGGATTYCTAKTNSLGCVPAISATGIPSASATSGFTLDVAMVRNNKSGLLFYTVNGNQAAVMFQCGTLCVGPGGIKRTPAQSAGGNPAPANDCSGVYSLDMNAFGAGLAGGNPDPALGVAGTTVHAQTWGRDQGFAAPCNTTLSDGIEYMIQS